MNATSTRPDPWGTFREMWWMDDVVGDHAAVEREYDEMYRLWHQSEAEFWAPMVGARETQRFGYSTSNRAWTRIKRINHLDRHVPQWQRSLRFRGVEAT